MFVRKLALSMIAASVFASVSAFAQTYPNRPVTLVVPSSPGGPPDMMTRILSERLTVEWGQPVVVDNRIGAGGNLGTAAVARAAPDGYTLLFAVAAPIVLNQYLFKEMPFNPAADLTPIGLVGQVSFVVAVNGNFEARTLADLIALAKASPGKLEFATGGSKNVPHFSGELLKQKTGIDMLHVPYRTAPQAVADLLKGDVKVMIDGAASFMPHLASGAVRLLAVTAPQRVPGLDDVPTVAETVPGYATVSWVGMMGPKGLPADIVAKVNRDVAKILGDPAVAKRYRDVGVFVAPGATADFVKFIETERTQWGPLVKSSGVEPE